MGCYNCGMVTDAKAAKRIKRSVIIALASLALTGCVSVHFQAPSDAGNVQESSDGGKAQDDPHSKEASKGKGSKDSAKTDGASDDSDPGVVSTERIYLDPAWEWADLAVIDTGFSVLYRAGHDRKNVVIAVNAGHGTKGGDTKRVYCHPDRSPKITNGSNPAGSLTAIAISLGMTFRDGSFESDVALATARLLRDKLLDKGYDVLMIRDSRNVMLDNVARTVIANNMAKCLVSIHFDDDGFKYDKGCFYVPTPDEIKGMEPVASVWREHDKLGNALLDGLSGRGCTIYKGKIIPQELTQTCYSKIPAVVIELGNTNSKHDDEALTKLAGGLCDGVEKYMEGL